MAPLILGSSTLHLPPRTPLFSNKMAAAECLSPTLHADPLATPSYDQPSFPSSSPVLRHQHRRPLSNNELSYFLPSRASGVNDMYLHHHLTARHGVFTRARVTLVWAILRGRHPLLASRVERMGGYNVWDFVHETPATVEGALIDASESLSTRAYASDKALIDSYLNGPRTLSSSHLSHLFISKQRREVEGVVATHEEVDVLLATTHFVGDGIALHSFANEFYGLLGGETILENEKLMRILEREMEERQEAGHCGLPLSCEERLSVLPQGSSAFHRSVSKVALADTERRAIGGQTIPRTKSKDGSVHTVVPTVSFPADETTRIIKLCKGQGVTISHALFALVSAAWKATDPREPALLYTAMSLRHFLPPLASLSPASPSFFHLALAYYTVTLPCLPIRDAATFWLRAREAKRQTLVAAKSKLVVGKALVEARERRDRAVEWAIKDDEAEKKEKSKKQQGSGGLVGLGLNLAGTMDRQATILSLPPKEEFNALPGGFVAPFTPPQSPSESLHNLFSSTTSSLASTTQSTPTFPAPSVPPTKPTTPTNAPLLGLSLLGNLDAIYSHASYHPPTLSLSTLTTGSRQRSGASLLFGYTFAGKLWLSLGYDERGVEERAMRGLWEGIVQAVGKWLTTC